MSIRDPILPLTTAAIAVLLFGQAARADLLIEIDKSAQRMTVTIDGAQRYKWPVSTGATGYDTPSGAFKPFRMEIDHTSDEYENAPMPYSIFFTMTGNAVHGTEYESSLGHAVSHGCVRLSVKNAATLWDLVKQQKMANTSVVVTGDIPEPLPSTATVSHAKPLKPKDQQPKPASPAAPPSLFSWFDHLTP
jgi:lipoprotein-anchoring transpeptidase ErfK/SrfK